jgi:hypothetical protein
MVSHTRLTDRFTRGIAATRADSAVGRFERAVTGAVGGQAGVESVT